MSFRINRVYTRSGDRGETGLVGGKRISKSQLRVVSFGDVDELNSFVGLLKERLNGKTSELKPLLEYLQQELFDLGSELATPPSAEYPQMLRVSEHQVKLLEKACDYYGDGLEELTSFILPGGSEVAANLHIVRTVCRRAERSVVKLSESPEPEDRVSTETIKYLNRLSDLFFILARWALKKEEKAAPLWQKGGKALPVELLP